MGRGKQGRAGGLRGNALNIQYRHVGELKISTYVEVRHLWSLFCFFVFRGVSSQTPAVCALLGDTAQKEMTPSKKIPVLVDGVVLNGPQTDAKAGEKFVEEVCRLVMEEVVLKATDVNEKVKRKHTRSPRSRETAQWEGTCCAKARTRVRKPRAQGKLGTMT